MVRKKAVCVTTLKVFNHDHSSDGISIVSVQIAEVCYLIVSSRYTSITNGWVTRTTLKFKAATDIAKMVPDSKFHRMSWIALHHYHILVPYLLADYTF